MYAKIRSASGSGFYMRNVANHCWRTPITYLEGWGIVIQIDESLVAKHKYSVDTALDQQWIFGLYDTTTKLGHIQLVYDRRADTLILIIQKFVLHGSTIFSDQWAIYGQLRNLGYNHQTVNHKKNFVDPQTSVCTNSIEAYWSRDKRSSCRVVTSCCQESTSFSGMTGCRTSEITRMSSTRCFTLWWATNVDMSYVHDQDS